MNLCSLITLARHKGVFPAGKQLNVCFKKKKKHSFMEISLLNLIDNSIFLMIRNTQNLFPSTSFSFGHPLK